VAISLEGFSSFLLIVIAPILLLSLAVLVGNKDIMHRSPVGIAKIYTWTVILPAYYLSLVFTFHVTLRYPLIGVIVFTVLTVGVLYIIGNLKGDSLKVKRFSRYDYMLTSMLAIVYILIPASITFLKKEFSIALAIYFAIAVLYFGYSFKLLREIHRSNKTPGTQK